MNTLTTAMLNMKLATITFLLLTLSLALVVKAKDVQVVTKLGPIKGQTVSSPYENLPVNQFLGIPYAKPPVENLRFLRPVPITEKWSEPLDATFFPSQCIQNKQLALSPFNEPLVLNRNFSEDCLYLNIWSPDVSVNDENNLKPVLVWIHGGALTIGTSSFDLYNGEVLSAAADALVVTINYRVSTLGFLYSSEVPEVGGNQGLFDQAAALEWIQEHIRYFGGDAKRVRIIKNFFVFIINYFNLFSGNHNGSKCRWLVSQFTCSFSGNEKLVSKCNYDVWCSSR